jgi:hypothetical protein
MFEVQGCTIQGAVDTDWQFLLCAHSMAFVGETICGYNRDTDLLLLRARDVKRCHTRLVRALDARPILRVADLTHQILPGPHYGVCPLDSPQPHGIPKRSLWHPDCA